LAEISWQDVANGAIDNQPAPVRESIKAAKSFACGLYKDYNQYFGNVAPITPPAAALRGVWDKICDPGSIPPPASDPPPWDGQSCACDTYLVKIRITGDGIQPIIGEVVVTGPVFGLVTVSSTETTKTLNVRHGRCADGKFVGTAESAGFSGNKDYNVSLSSITKLSSGSGCQPPTPTPVPAPTPPPPERQRDNANLTIAPNLTINAPITLVGPATNLTLNPSVEIAVGPINVNFNLGGINVGFNPTFSPVVVAPVVVLPPLPPGVDRPTPLPQPGSDCPDPCPEIDYTRIERAIASQKKFYAKPKTRLVTVSLGNGRGGSTSLPTRTRFVRVTLTALPIKLKGQAGTGGPDVIFAGWVGFGFGGPGDRTPISYQVNSYAIPPGCDRFTWTVYQGGSATVEAIVEEDLAACETTSCE
jgi:hypothetical protein